MLTSEKKSVLANARDIAFLAAIYLIFCGYLFRWLYYSEFGLPNNAVTVDSTSLFVYCYNVFMDAWWIFLLYVAAFGAIWWGLRAIRRARRFRLIYVVFRRWSEPLFLIILFLVLARMAGVAASIEAERFKSIRTPDKSVTLELEKSALSGFKQEEARALMEAAGSHELHLLAISNDTLYLCLRRSYVDHGESRVGDFVVFAVPRTHVMHFEIDIP